ncbi:sigma-70 family RNA polymerase sigma factor [Agromyces mediolanus]|uniref:RNA polymerase sigma factor n=1 Tax=Agromyces mediolanus TaxID=41986 RepID=UPI00203D5A65|nr:sigma-70 family RNA polymerase sigma factor [Agromyces mediolanus]MCM3656344.1 sigma-70 family RNA polymerase sigma factor [Agromyces mediolanus]
MIAAVRGGDRAAFQALWERHVDAAYRYARHALPAQADDLVSEAFLAIFQQLTTTEAGPTFAFRSYLKTVIRNTAISWRRDGDRVLVSDEIDQIDDRDGLSQVARDADAVEVIATFEELPQRWQRVLWLTEVEDLGRPQLAKELGIKPNAVSALQRRARAGMRLSWLERQIPVSLRADVDHVARLLPQHLTEPKNASLAAEVGVHLAACLRCRDVLSAMRGSLARVRGGAFSAALLGAFGTGGPGVAWLAAPPAAAAGTAVVAWLLAGGVAATVGGIAIPYSVADQSVAGPPAPPAITATPRPTPVAATGPEAVTAQEPEAAAPQSPPESPATGRQVGDPTVPVLPLVIDPSAEGPTSPGRPHPTDSAPSPGSEPTPNSTPGVSTPLDSTGYLAPVLAGKATPGQQVAIELVDERYAPTVAPDGSWNFNPRGLELRAGTYPFKAWVYDAETQSAATAGSFTILPPVVEGFEQIRGTEDMTVEEASTTGLVIALTGPANGTVYVSTIEGHTAYIPLDANGYTRQRLTMQSRGWYYFTFRVVDEEGYVGPEAERALDVYDPLIIFDPWGPSPDEMTFTVEPQ